MSQMLKVFFLAASLVTFGDIQPEYTVVNLKVVPYLFE